MKWSSGFKKVTVGSEKNSECKEHVQDITVDTFTEEDLRGAMKSEIDTLGNCSKFPEASKIQLFLCITIISQFTDLQLMNVMRKGRGNENI